MSQQSRIGADVARHAGHLIDLLTIEEDLLDDAVDELDLPDLLAVLRDLRPLLDYHDPEVLVRTLKATATAVNAADVALRRHRGALVADLNAGGLSYSAIGDLFGVTGERARQWALDAPPTSNNPNP